MALLETNPNDSRIMELADKLNQIERNLRESPLYQLPPFPTDGDIPLPMALQLVSSIAVSGATKVVLNWIKPPNPNIDHFEVWVQRTAFQSENPYQIAAVDDAPAAFTITTDQDTAALMTVRTVMKNGLSTDLRSSPTAAVNVYKFVASAADIAAGAIGDSHFDRLTANKIVIENADIGSLNASKINAGYIAAARLDATVIYISDGAMIANAIIGNAHISDLSADKLTAGTINAAVITVNNLDASKITTGTLSANYLSSGTANVGVGGLTVNGTGGITCNNVISGLQIKASDDVSSGGYYLGAQQVIGQDSTYTILGKFTYVTCTSGYMVNFVDVVGARKTGWTAPTGTATRTGFATSTVTTEVLAQHVKALVDDLTTHGLIGS